MKHEFGSVMVLSCMSASGTRNLAYIDIIMTNEVYLDILKTNIKFSAFTLGMPPVNYFQQYNDPKHTASIVKEWLLYNAPKRLKNPPHSHQI